MNRSARVLVTFVLLVACGETESTSQCDPEASGTCGEGGGGAGGGGGGAGGAGSGGAGGTGGAAPNDCDQQGNWFDTVSGLCWQAQPTSPPVFAADADAFCDELELDGHLDWRLPNISELRTLIRGCADTELGGVCGVTSTCTGIECEDDEDCLGCVFQAGPGPGGCYWDMSLGDNCDTPSWSSSPEVNDYVWAIDFSSAYLTERFEEEALEVRCVRTP